MEYIINISVGRVNYIRNIKMVKLRLAAPISQALSHQKRACCYGCTLNKRVGLTLLIAIRTVSLSTLEEYENYFQALAKLDLERLNSKHNHNVLNYTGIK